MKKKYNQPRVEIIIMGGNSLLAGSIEKDPMRETWTGKGDNSLSGNVGNGNHYTGYTRSKRMNCWESWDEY